MRGILVVVAIVAMGCGGDTGAPVDAGPPDATGFPAYGVPQLPVAKGPGNVMTTVRVVPVFFANDPLHDQVLDYLTKYAASPYWAAQVGEYGVGAISIAAPVELTDPSPASITDGEIMSFLQSELDGTHPEWGATDTPTIAKTVYLLLYQEGTAVDATSRLGPMCTRWGAFHWHEPDPGHGASIIYAVVPRCALTQGSPFTGMIDQVTSLINHEIVEAATDPLLNAWNWYTAKTAGWALALDGEVADLCEHSYHSWFTPPDLGYMIQRSWSNIAAQSELDPCVPEIPDDGPYFNAIVPVPDFLDLSWGQVNGIAVPAGASRTIPVELFSDAPTGPWQLAVYDQSPDQVLQVSLASDFGSNGDSISMTVSLAGTPAQGYAAGILYSYDGVRDNVWPFVVAPAP